MIILYCTLRRIDSLCMLARRFCVSRKIGTGGGGWGHPHIAVHMAAVRLSCKSNMVGTGWANSPPGYMSRLRKCYSHLLWGSFQARKASWAPSGCLLTKSADYCMLVNEWVWLRSQVCLLSLKVVRFLSQSSDRNEDMVHYKHIYVKSGLKWNKLRCCVCITFCG